MKTVVKTLLFLLSFSGCNELWMSSCWGLLDEDGAAKSSSGGKGMSAEGGGDCRGGARRRRRTKKLLARGRGRGTHCLFDSKPRSVVKLLSFFR